MRYLLIILSQLLFFSSCASFSITGNEFYKWHSPSQTKKTADTLKDLTQHKKLIEVTDLIFHDWAYPSRKTLALQKNKDNNIFLKLKLDSQSRKYHGLKFRVDSAHNYENALHRSGQKIIGFIKYSDSSLVGKMKQLYISKDSFSIKGYYIGVLPAKVWSKDIGQITEEDMPAFIIESISSW
jgi:hypothetical protein